MNKDLELRRPYFVDVSLEDSPGFCIDDRISDNSPYIKFPGGLLFLATNLAIMRSLNNQPPISQLEALQLVSQSLNEKGLSLGIHSDDSCPDISSLDGPIGCGYLAKGPEIAGLIGSKSKDILKKLENLRPDLFGEESESIGLKITAAFEDLKRNDLFFSTKPREIARGAINLGAPYMVVSGQHDPRAIGIINLVQGTTLDTAQAAREGYPAYNFDAWAFNEVGREIEPLKSYDQTTLEQVAAIGAIATFWLLGVNDIYVRN